MIDTADLMKYCKKYLTTLSESIISIIEDERFPVKYGPTLLSNLIKSSDPRLINHMDDIYNKCIKLVKEDQKGNIKFLNIITSSMDGLYEEYSDYITKFNSEMFMNLDPLMRIIIIPIFVLNQYIKYIKYIGYMFALILYLPTMFTIYNPTYLFYFILYISRRSIK
jgi:hypothetical protein